ncbi:MAG: hypothetical protein ABJC04_03550 [Verrucomicrobiota bacterium]
MAKTHEYKKLAGRGTRFEGGRFIAGYRLRATLWLGLDHLLLILSTSFNQEFKRFYFKDIQAFTLRQTKRAFAWNVILGVLAGIFFFFTILIKNQVAWWIFIGVGTIFAISLLINFLLGPTCITQIKTAVQTEELSSLKRLRTARKVLHQLRPIVEQAQNGVTAPTPLLVPSPPT